MTKSVKVEQNEPKKLKNVQREQVVINMAKE
jgi:hypothetical protein